MGMRGPPGFIGERVRTHLSQSSDVCQAADFHPVLSSYFMYANTFVDHQNMPLTFEITWMSVILNPC